MANLSDLFRHLPSVNEILDSPPLRKMASHVNPQLVATGVRDFLANLRDKVQSAAAGVSVPTPTDIADQISKWFDGGRQPGARPVINATGVLLPAGIGAPLAERALQAVAETAAGYAHAELDPATGQVAPRTAGVGKLLARLTGAESAIVVHSHAAAIWLVLSTLAAGKAVLVSRGQLFEVGEGYRLPDLIAASGCRLHEVGTTNKTRGADFSAAINEQTAVLFQAHSGSFQVAGATESTSLEQLATLGKQHHLPVIADLGIGGLWDLGRYQMRGEPVASESIAAGADLVIFSGDKLLGGPECGIVVGKRGLLEKISKHQLLRALEVDKLNLAALAATLELYQDANLAEQSIPLLSLLATPLENLRNRAERLVPQLRACAAFSAVEALADEASLEEGSPPSQRIATWTIALTPAKGTANGLAQMLRGGSPAVLCRIKNERLLLDLRSVFPRQDSELVAAVLAATNTPASATA